MGEVGTCAFGPGTLTGKRTAVTQERQVGGAHPVEHPPGRRRGRHRPEQPGSVAQLAKVADRVGTIGDRNGEIGEHAAGEVDWHRLVGADERRVPGVDQAGVTGELSQQLRPGVGHHALTVCSDSHPCQLAATLHLEGVLP